MDARHDSERDSGAVLLLILVVAIVLSLVVLALANFVAADLRYTQAVNARAETLSTAESGIDYAVARLRANQTLCATNVAGSGPVGLNGTAAPTALPGPLNDSVNTLTCERTNTGFAAVAGWSVIVTNGSQPDAIKVDVDKDRSILGPMYVSNLGNIDLSSASRLFSSDGDLWYQDGTCASPLAAGVLSSRVVLTAPLARGPMCTTAAWSAIVSAPPVPNLNLLAPGDRFGLPGPCLVFVPGHYTQVPVIPDNATVYFQSGDYWFDNVGEWLIEDNVHVSAGHPGSVTVPSDACDGARSADPNVGGVGATFYLGGDSRIRLDDRGSLEMFARQQGNFFVNIQALSATDGYAPASNPGADRSLVRTRPVNSVHLVIRGLVWSPTSRIVLDNPHLFSTVHQLLGGVVTYQLWIGDTTPGGPTSAADVVRPATGATDAVIRLRSASTRDGVTTTVEAIVQYRPQADDPNERVAVNSSRVLD